jgi:sugar phosphate isomerase/epimerase
MRIGFICDLSENDFAFARQNGFKCVEFNGADNVDFTSKAPELARYAREYGVEFDMIGLFGRNYISDDPEERAHHIADAKKTIDFCDAIGSPLFVTGAGHEDDRPLQENVKRAVDVLGELIEYGKAKGIRVALYNCHWGNFAVAPDSWELLMPQLPDLGIKYDPSHALEDNRDYLVELRDWGTKVYHAHAKGSLVIGGKRFPDPMPGMDQTNWGAIFAILYEQNYPGDMNIEPHSGEWTGGRRYPGLLFAKRYLEQFII